MTASLAHLASHFRRVAETEQRAAKDWVGPASPLPAIGREMAQRCETRAKAFHEAAAYVEVIAKEPSA